MEATWWFVKDSFHSSIVFQDFSRSYDRCSTHVLSWGVQVFFILHVEVLFFLPYLLRWCYIILDNFHSCLVIHMLSRMRYFKSINLFVWVILCHIPLKAFPKECYYCGAYQWSKLSLYHLGGRSFFISLVFSIKLIDSVSGRISPQFWDVFHKSMGIISFVVDFPTTPFNPS